MEQSALRRRVPPPERADARPRGRGRAATIVLALLAALACDRPAVEAVARVEPLRFTQLDAGHVYTCGVDTEGGAWCWGQNRSGALGIGDTLDRFLPTRVPLPFVAAQVVTGWSHACAIGVTGDVACWGDNRHFALGEPARARVVTPLPAPVNGVRAIALGRYLSCALDARGDADCWGNDHRGERGDGDGFGEPSATPQRVVGGQRWQQLDAGWQHVCAIAVDSLAWCWGDGHGLGRGSLADSDVPVLVDSSRRFLTLSAGESVSCAIDAERQAWCWGIDYNGQLGEGLPPRPNRFVPIAVAGGHRFVSIAAGQHRVCALDIDGAAWCWGSNYKGALGDGQTVSQPAPVRVVHETPFRALAAGDGHTCALDVDGRAWCWGENVDAVGGGALGDGTMRNRAVPTAVAAPDVGDRAESRTP